MTEKEFYDLRFPIGEFVNPDPTTKAHLDEWIASIESFPARLEAVIKDLNEDELNYKYRPNGWTIKQLVHHCADSHMHTIIRFKLALTEKKPTIRPYHEDRFAKMIDYEAPIDSALSILKGVHKKLGILLKSFDELDLKRAFIHPEYKKRFSLSETIGFYAWHGDHHLTHIKQALKYKDTFQ